MSNHPTNQSVQYKSLAFFDLPAYRVGDDGSVWSCLRWTRKGQDKSSTSRYYLSSSWKRIKPFMAGPDLAYPCVGLRTMDHRIKKISVHRLVLLAFVGPCPEGMEACHNDGDSTNNSLSNLRWDTPKNNHADKKKHGTVNLGEENPSAKLTEEQVRMIRRLYDLRGVSIYRLAKDFGCSWHNIRNIVTRKIWNHVV